MAVILDRAVDKLPLRPKASITTQVFSLTYLLVYL